MFQKKIESENEKIERFITIECHTHSNNNGIVSTGIITDHELW